MKNQFDTFLKPQKPNVNLKSVDSFRSTSFNNESFDISISDSVIGNGADLFRDIVNIPFYCSSENEVIKCSIIAIILLLVFNILIFVFMLYFNVNEMIKMNIKRKETLKKFKDRLKIS